MPYNLNDAGLKKFIKARAWLLRENRFLGALAMRLEPEETDDPETKFMRTNGDKCFYNRARVLKEAMEDVAVIIAHEASHCSLGHFARRGNRDPDKWNIAADHAANNLLRDAGFNVPEYLLCDPQFAGMTAERIYNALPDDPKEADPDNKAQDGKVEEPGDDSQPQPGDQDAPGADPGQPGDGKPDDKPGDGQPDKTPQQRADDKKGRDLMKEWAKATAEAETVAIIQGDMPADLKRRLAEAREEPRNWRALMEHMAHDPNKTDYRFSPPSRRHLWRGAYLPSLRGEELSIFALFVDTSGSISDEQTSEFIKHGADMLDSGIIGELVIIACDARAHFIGRYRRGEEMEIDHLPGGGGTDFRPPFEMLAEMDINPTAAGYLTDLAGRFPDEEPAYPVLWLAINPGTAPFGTTVQMH